MILFCSYAIFMSAIPHADAGQQGGSKPVKNGELWQELLDAAEPLRVDWRWVKGHSGHPENERADKPACDAAIQFSRR